MSNKTNNTGMIQWIDHPKYGYMIRKIGRKKFGTYTGPVPGMSQRALTIEVDYSEVNESMIANAQRRKSTVIICSECNGLFKTSETEDGVCRDCYIDYDSELERYHTSIDRFAASRTACAGDSAGDTLGRFA